MNLIEQMSDFIYLKIVQIVNNDLRMMNNLKNPRAIWRSRIKFD